MRFSSKLGAVISRRRNCSHWTPEVGHDYWIVTKTAQKNVFQDSQTEKFRFVYESSLAKHRFGLEDPSAFKSASNTEPVQRLLINIKTQRAIRNILTIRVVLPRLAREPLAKM